MKTYICHFDASLKNGKAACAFTICCDGTPVYHDVVVTRCTKSDMAEAIALFFLLTYVEININPGCKIKIHGDAKGLIDSINNGISHKYSQPLSLYITLKQTYKMNLSHIPRKLNKAADTLARKAIKADMRREICLKDIIVSDNHILPGEKKLRKLEEYYKRTGKLLTDIRVSKNNRLICGYGEYMVLLNANVESWMVCA